MDFFINILLPLLVSLFVLVDGIVLWRNKNKLVFPFILGWSLYRLFSLFGFLTPASQYYSSKAMQNMKSNKQKAALHSLLNFIQKDVSLWIIVWGEIIFGGLTLISLILYYVLLILYF